MSEENRDKLTCKCPNGHKIRGDVAIIGKSVRCPRCEEKFVFGYTVRENVSDTSVMRILGDYDPLPAPKATDDGVNTKHCGRCGSSISADASVCTHCNCYVGSLPDFFRKLRANSRPSFN